MLSIPKFASEREEADWWYDHRDDLDREMLQAAAEGRLRRVRNVLRDGKIHRVSFSRVFVLSDDLALAKKLAASRGLSVDDFVGNVLHDALLREEGATPSAT